MDPYADPYTTITDDALDGAPEAPPPMQMVVAIVELVWGTLMAIVVVVAVMLAYLSSMQGGGDIVTVFIRLIADLLAGRVPQSPISPFLFLLALLLSITAQVIILSSSQSLSSVWHRIRHVQTMRGNLLHATSDVWRHLTLRFWLTIIALAANGIGIVRFFNLYTADAYILVLCPVLLLGSSTLILLHGGQRIWGAVQSQRDYDRYEQQQNGW